VLKRDLGDGAWLVLLFKLDPSESYNS